MSYIGRGVDNISNVEKLDNITFDGGTTYALTKSSVAYTPSSSNCILLSIDGIVQQGNFSVSTTNIVFDWSPTSSNTCDWILHIGVGLISTPADSSVTASKLGSLAVTGAKLNTDVISAQTELAVAPADADEFMVSDGGVLKRIDYSLIKGGDNTPAFAVTQTSAGTTVSNDTETKVTWDTETFDTDSAFASDRFTVPSGADGKYFFTGVVPIYFFDDDDKYLLISIYKNGSAITTGRSETNNAKRAHASVSSILDLSATDYVELYVSHTSGTEVTQYDSKSFFGGFKLAGV